MITLSFEEAINTTCEVARNLIIHSPSALIAIATSTRRVDRSMKKKTIKRLNPFGVHTSTVTRRSGQNVCLETLSTSFFGSARGTVRYHAVSIS